MWSLYGYGLPAALFGFACSVPRLVMVVIGRSSQLAAQSPFELCDLMASLLILFVLIQGAFAMRKIRRWRCRLTNITSGAGKSPPFFYFEFFLQSGELFCF